MSDDKVVGFDGKPVVHTSDTEQKVYDALAWAKGELDGEKHTAIGVVVVDHMGRVGTHFYWAAGFAHNSMSGAALLLKRMQENYEMGVKSEAPPPSGEQA